MIGRVNRDGLRERQDLLIPATETMPAREVGHELTAKQLQQYAYGAGAHLLASSFGAKNVRVWIDPDNTRIEWIGARKQANRQDMFIEPENPVRMLPCLRTQMFFHTAPPEYSGLIALDPGLPFERI